MILHKILNERGKENPFFFKRCQLPRCIVYIGAVQGCIDALNCYVFT